MCVKNSAGIIGEAIESIINQDYSHELMEIVFVDDGSEDGTLSVMESFASKLDMRLKVFHHDWKGLGFSRNVVVNNANGEYIIWVDGDMTLYPDFVRKQVEFMDANPTVGIGKGKYCLFGQGSLVGDLENMEFATRNLRKRGKYSPLPLGAGGAVYRVKALKQAGGFDQNLVGSGEDMDAEHRVSNLGWLLDVTSAMFYERRRKSWGSLWKEYFWHGTGNSRVFQKRMETINPYKLFPFVALKVEAGRVGAAYKLTRRKVALLLPMHYAFKRTAWLLGFIKGLLEKQVVES
jgi:glycosyltransferase involved in cell wall biosynthesis